MTAATIIQSLASGLLMGLLYGLIAVGLALIFGLMDVVNFAHGEFLMIAMYATFFLFTFFAIDPLLAAPLVAAALFVFGALVYLLVVRFAVRAKANAGMVQIFSTFGLAIAMRGLAQFFFTPDYRSVTHSWLGGKTISIYGIFLPVPQLVGALVSIAAFAGLYFFIHRTDFGRALEATREDAGAVALVGIDKNRVFALGWGLGAALWHGWYPSEVGRGHRKEVLRPIVVQEQADVPRGGGECLLVGRIVSVALILEGANHGG